MPSRRWIEESDFPMGRVLLTILCVSYILFLDMVFGVSFWKTYKVSRRV